MALSVNIHPIERVARGVVGVVLIALVFVGPQTPWGWLGVIPLATSILGWCPPYAMLGISTCPRNEAADAAGGTEGGS